MATSPALQTVIAATVPNPPAGDSLNLQVTVRNIVDHTITLLNWNSPLDPDAGMLGIFYITDTESGENTQGLTVNFARLLPPTADSLVEIPGGGTADNSVQIQGLDLVAGRAYEVEAKGKWKGVWDLPLSDVTGDILETMQGASTGEFSSNKIAVTVE